MKKVIEVEALCCKSCGDRVQRKLMLLDGVKGAKAKYKKNIIFVESDLPDKDLCDCVEAAGFVVTNVRPRRGIFG